MIAKEKNFNMLIDAAKTRLIQLAECVRRINSLMAGKPVVPVMPEAPVNSDEPVPPSESEPQQESVHTIRFTNEDEMVEGELFEFV